MKMKKRVISVLTALVLLASLCSMALAAPGSYFDADLTVETRTDSVVVTVPDSPVLQEKKPSLKIAYSGASAAVLHGGTVGEATVAEGFATFQVTEGGSYILAAGSFTGSLTTAPDCTHEGQYTYTDGTKTFTETIPATGHDFSDTRKPTCANCTEPNPNYRPLVTGKPGVSEQVSNPFRDVNSDAYYYDAVLWALEHGVTTGNTADTFGPALTCTRAQAVTFLWRAAGSPAPAHTGTAFSDVERGSYYEKAVGWAVENGITKGTTDTTFGPEETVTRAQVVTFLWRVAGSPSVISDYMFSDVENNVFYEDAVSWAIENGITMGTSSWTFSPEEKCTRAQVVTFLYRASEN